MKDNLSKYLKMVTAGVTIWVTDRDEVIAEIHRPTLPIPGKISRWEAFLNDEERRGSLKRAAAPKTPSLRRLRDIPRPEKAINLQKLLDDIKGD